MLRSLLKAGQWSISDSMPDKTQHTELALHNIDVTAHLLDTDSFRDWAATVAFYCGLHVVEAIIFVNPDKEIGKHCPDHYSREKALKRNGRLREIHEHYCELRITSRIARYFKDSNGKSAAFDDYMSASQVKTHIREHLGGLLLSTSKILAGTDSAKKLNERFAAILKPKTAST
jgi:hypothetical protein